MDFGFSSFGHNLVDVSGVCLETGNLRTAYIAFHGVEGCFLGGLLNSPGAPENAYCFRLYSFPESAVLCLRIQHITVLVGAVVIDCH